MGKKIMLGIILVLIFLTSTGVGFYIVKIQSIDENDMQTQVSKEKITDECVEEGKEFLEANANEQKVSPNAIIIAKIYYTKCGHTITSKMFADEKIVNMTESEIKEYYKDWILEAFSPNEIVVKMEAQGNCGEHYVLREEDEKIVVYKLDDEKQETLVEKTEIVTKYLPETDRINIKNGIYVNGKEALNCLLEDYE